MEILGASVLETGVDLKGLDAGLRTAEARVARSAAVMQAMLDRLHADVDVRVNAIEAAAARVAASSVATPGSAAQPGRAVTNVKAGEPVWGIRGPVHAGSLQNPIVTVMAASKFFPMGSYGAAIGDSNQADEQRGDQGFATAADMAALTAAVSDLARNANPVNGLAAAGQQGMTEPGAAERTVVTLDRQNGDALGRAAAAMESIAAQNRVSGQDERTLLAALRSSGTNERDLSAAMFRVRMGGRTASGSNTKSFAAENGSGAPDAALLAAIDRLSSTDAGAATRLATAVSAIRDAEYVKAAAAARGAGSSTGGPFAYAFGGGGNGGGWPPVAFGAGGGNGGGPIVPVPTGGGGGGNRRSALLPALLWGGGGMLGLAGFGSLASFAGLGPEHLLMTLLGIAGSAGSALGGAGLLGLGAAGVAGAGMAADASGIGQAANDIKSVVQAQNNLSQAVAVYGKGSRQATIAQKELNAALAGFSPVARAAVLQAANTAQAFHQAFNQATGPAEAVGATILNQGMRTGMAFLPALGQAALTDANLIKQGLQPLFTWLSGPQGLGIFQDLEHEFTQNLPYAVDAFDNGTEAVLRIMDLASHSTGGFTEHVDDLLKKLNGMSDVQLEQVIKRLISDFRVWERFIKAAGVDVDRLFNNDVGTGRSIIVTLTRMLQHVGKYENSVDGRQHLMTIFTVHKNEVQALLHLLPLLVDPLARLYMTVAPAATGALTDLAKAITAVVKAIESVPGGSWILAIGLLTSKLGLASSLLGGGLLRRGAAGAGAGAVEGAGGAAAGGLLSRLLGVVGRTGAGQAVAGGVEAGALGAAGAAEGAGLAGLADAITAAGVAVAPLAAGLLPVLGAAGGVYGLIKLFGLLSSSAKPTTSYTSGQLTRLLRSPQPGVLSLPANPGQRSPQTNFAGEPHAPGVLEHPQATALKDIAPTKQAQAALQKWYDTVSKSNNVSKMSVAQLAAMVREGDRLATVFPKDAQLIDKLNAPVKTTLAGLRNVIQLMMGRWIGDAGTGLHELRGVFTSNLDLISSKVGLSSHEGERLWKTNIDQMVKDVTEGMLKGKIAMKSGMDAINQVTAAGVKGQAITWQQQSSLILSSIDSLFHAGKISPEQYYKDLAQITLSGMQKAKSDALSTVDQQVANTKAKFAQGNDGLIVTQAELNAQLHQIRERGNVQASKDMQAWVAGLVSQMSAGGQVSVQGANAILTPLNQALKELGQKPVSLVSLAASSQTPKMGAGLQALPGPLGSAVSLPGSTGAAGGALYQIGAPGQGGRDTVPLNVAGTPVMVGAGEQVAVFNRHQQPIVNMALSLLGYDGMNGLFSDVSTPNYLAGGGTIKTPHAVGGGAQGTLLNAAFRMLGVDANRKLHHAQAASPGGAHHGSGTSAGGQFNSGQLARLWTSAGGPPSIAHLMAAIALAESGGNPGARNPSGASGLWQILGLPFPGNVFDPDTNARMAVAKYMSQGLGAWVTYTSGAYKQFYASGGRLPRMFHAGGVHGGGASVGGGKPKLSDMARIKNAMTAISGLVGSNVGSGGDAGRMQEMLAYWPQLWSLYDPNLGQPASAYITTTDALGNSVAPSINEQAVNLSAGELTRELGWENRYVKDVGSAAGMAQTWRPRVITAIQKRRGEIAKLRSEEAAKVKALRAAEASQVKAIKEKINANLKQIAAYKRQITTLNDKIAKEQGKRNPNYSAISGWRKQVNDLYQKITNLEGDNQKLGGAGTYVGTGGEIASTQSSFGSEITGTQKDYGAQISGLQSEVSTLSGYSSTLAAIPGTVYGVSGVGGLIGPAKIQQHTLGTELAQLQPGALQAALAVAAAQYAANNPTGSGTGSTPSPTASDLTSLLEQQNLTLAQQLAVSQAQYGVLAHMPPYAGVFHRGGVVPGPVGAEMMARVQGGEVITPVGGTPPAAGGGGDGAVHVHLHGALAGLERFIDVRVEKGTRRMASAAGSPRPGQRRGLIAPLR